jgi:hypothetical protein
MVSPLTRLLDAVITAGVGVLRIGIRRWLWRKRNVAVVAMPPVLGECSPSR